MLSTDSTATHIQLYTLALCIFITDIYIIPLTLYAQKQTRPRGYKSFFMLNSVEHEILNAQKYKNIKKFGFF